MASSSSATIEVPRLATVELTRKAGWPRVVIRLDDRHDGQVHPLTLDIDDFLPTRWKQGDVYWDSSVNDTDDPRFVKFMEQLHHWDHDRDGEFDGDEAARQIQEALLGIQPLQPFRRPSDGLYTRILMALMPPAPKRHITYSLGDLRLRFRKHHYLLGVLGVVAVTLLMTAQQNLWPVMKYSVVTGIAAAGNRFGWLVVGAIIAAYLAASWLFAGKAGSEEKTFSVHTIGFLNKAAAWEEQSFREGAEHWNWEQRLRSCLLFGLIHLPNLIYPMASVLPLALGGAWFMWVYLHNLRRTHNRRLAVLAAAVVHRAYNKVALIAIAIWLTFLAGNALFGLLFTSVVAIEMAISQCRRRSSLEVKP